MAGNTVHLDFVSETDATRGLPFTLVVDVPIGSGWSAIAARTLGRWTAEARELGLQLESARSPVRLRISDGQNALRLDVVEILLDDAA
jgi:hypothetical protein